MNRLSVSTLSKFTKQNFEATVSCSWKFSQEKRRFSSSSGRFKRRSRPLFVGAIAGVGSFALWRLFTKSSVIAGDSSEFQASEDISSYGSVREDLVFYTEEEVSKHKNKADRIWVTYKSGVYDITDFLDAHPRAELILLAAGGSIESSWDVYQFHKTPRILKMLEKFRVGNVKSDGKKKSTSDPWMNEPFRSPNLIVKSVKPFNAESPLNALVSSFTTPNELFFVRNNLPVPMVDASTYKLKIKGIGVAKPISLTLNELKTRFPKTSVTMTIHCAGNRLSEMDRVKPVKGVFWGRGAVSTATWTGVRLTDLLDFYGVKRTEESIRHVHFVGLDKDPLKGDRYGASVPAFRVLDPKSDVLIAYEMNGCAIPRDHGYPVRAIIPGVIGARQVKWLSKIVLSDKENDSHWQRSENKGFSPSVDASNADYGKNVSIQEYPIQSAICTPEDGSVVQVEANGTILVKGYAWSGGGRGIIRVDVSLDDGVSWLEAELLGQNDRTLYRNWAWTQWQVRLPVPKGQSELKIVCKATDSSYCCQPESIEGIWNFRGLLNNAWNRIHVKCTT